MKIRRGGPDAVERRGLVAVGITRRESFTEPTPVVMIAKRRAEAFETRRVGSDPVDRNDFVGIICAGPVGAVTTRTVVSKELFAAGG